MAFKRIENSEGYKSTARKPGVGIGELVRASTNQAFIIPNLYAYDADSRLAMDAVAQGFGQSVLLSTGADLRRIEPPKVFFEDEENFDPYHERYDGLTISDRPSRSGARSHKEMMAMNAAIEREDDDRDIQDRAGFLASMVATLPGIPFDPVSRMSFGAGAVYAEGATLLRTMSILSLSGMAGNAVAEGPLLATQERRTIEESALAVLAGGALGGLLGVGFHAIRVRPTQMAAFEREMVQAFANPEGPSVSIKAEYADIGPPVRPAAEAAEVADDFAAKAGDDTLDAGGIDPAKLEELDPELQAMVAEIDAARAAEESSVPRGTPADDVGAGPHPYLNHADEPPAAGVTQTESELISAGWVIENVGAMETSVDMRNGSGLSAYARHFTERLSDSTLKRGRALTGGTRPRAVSERISEWHDRQAQRMGQKSTRYREYRNARKAERKGKEASARVRMSERDIGKLKDIAGKGVEKVTGGRAGGLPPGDISELEFSLRTTDAIQRAEEVRVEGAPPGPIADEIPQVTSEALADAEFYGSVAKEIRQMQDDGILFNFLPEKLDEPGKASTTGYLTRIYERPFLRTEAGKKRWVDVVSDWLLSDESKGGRDVLDVGRTSQLLAVDDVPQARAEAQAALDFILGEPAGMEHFNPSGVTMAGPLHQRVLDIPDSVLARNGFTVRDSRKLLTHYTEEVIPMIEVSKLGGGAETRQMWRDARIWQLMDGDETLTRSSAEARINAITDDSGMSEMDKVFARPQDFTGVEQLIEMEKQFRMKKLQADGNPAAAEHIKNEHAARWKDTKSLVLAMTGQLGRNTSDLIPTNRFGFSEKSIVDFAAGLRSQTYNQSSGMMVTAQVMDVGATVIHKGMWRILKDLVVPAMGDAMRFPIPGTGPGSLRLGWWSMKKANIGMEMELSNRTFTLNGLEAPIGREATTFGVDRIMDKFATGSRSMAAMYSKINIMAQWHAAWKRINAMTAVQELAEYARDAFAGKLGHSNRVRAGDLGLSDEMLVRIHKELDGKTTDRGWVIHNAHEWDDDVAFREFELAIRADADRGTPTPSAGSIPVSFFRQDRLGLINTPFQFHKFPLMANQKFMVMASQMLHLPGWESRLKVTAAMATWYGISMAREWGQHHVSGRAEEMEGKPAEWWLANASRRIDAYGIIPDMMGILHDVSRSAGIDWYDYENEKGEKVFGSLPEPWDSDFADYAAGASLDTAQAAARTVGAIVDIATGTPFHETTNAQRRAMRRTLAPYTLLGEVRQWADTNLWHVDHPQGNPRSERRGARRQQDPRRPRNRRANAARSRKRPSDPRRSK